MLGGAGVLVPVQKQVVLCTFACLQSPKKRDPAFEGRLISPHCSKETGGHTQLTRRTQKWNGQIYPDLCEIYQQFANCIISASDITGRISRQVTLRTHSVENGADLRAGEHPCGARVDKEQGADQHEQRTKEVGKRSN